MECDPAKIQFKNLLVRTKGQVDDLAKYDHATLNLATVGFPGVYNLGELWVSYDVTLMAPRVQDSQQFLFLENGSGFGGLTHLAITDGAYLVPQPDAMKDQPGVCRNTLGWMSQSMNPEGGTPTPPSPPAVFEVPAGTNGIFSFVCKASTTAGNWNDVPLNWKTVRGGAVTALSQFHLRYGLDSTWIEVIKVEANPTESLFMYPVAYLATTTNTGCNLAHLSINRLPDNYFRAVTTGVGVVAAHSKVRRGPGTGAALRGGQYATRSVSALEVQRPDTSTDSKSAPEPEPAPLLRLGSPYAVVQEPRRR